MDAQKQFVCVDMLLYFIKNIYEKDIKKKKDNISLV